MNFRYASFLAPERVVLGRLLRRKELGVDDHAGKADVWQRQCEREEVAIGLQVGQVDLLPLELTPAVRALT
jgi:hypothetical protein